MSDKSLQFQADVEAEQSLLGAVLVNPAIYYQVSSVLPEHFHQQINGWIWASIRDLVASSTPVDLMTVTDRCERMGHDLVQMGKMSYLTELIEHVPSSMHADAYAKIVLDKSARRKLINIATAIGAGAHNAERDVDHIVSDAMQHLQTTAVPDGGAKRTASDVDALLDEFFMRLDNPVDVWGIPTGFKKYDRSYGGIHPGELVLVAGKPGAGKSSLVTQIGYQMAGVRFFRGMSVDTVPGVMYHLEMSAASVLRRSACNYAQIRMQRVRTGKFDNYTDAANDYAKALQLLRDAPVWISDATHWTTTTMMADIARMIQEHGVQWAVVDYAGLLNDKASNQLEKEVLVSQSLKNIAKNLNIAIIAVEQLKKDGFGSSGDGLGKLKGSGQKSYDAHVVAFLEELEDGGNANRTLVMHKVRDGAQAAIPLVYQGEYYRFLPAAHKNEQPPWTGSVK